MNEYTQVDENKARSQGFDMINSYDLVKFQGSQYSIVYFVLHALFAMLTLIICALLGQYNTLIGSL